jgi:DNA polymerase III alpha subunit
MAITQYDKDAIEDLGLVKMDILGSRALTTLVDTVHASGLGAGVAGSKSKGGSELEKRLQTIPVDDERTYRMMAEGHTLGCFQLESPGMRGLLKWLRPRNLDQVAIAISLFRPGPLEGGFLEAFMRRHLGEETITYAHPSMEPILKDTKGVILFQEQFLKLVNRLGGLSLGEAEQLRKALGKTRSADERTRLGNEFVAGAIERGIDQLQAQRVWDIVAGYSGFGFCAAHAHSYALVAYRSAYMKAHYPAEFLAAQINNGGGYYGPAVYVEDARRLGIKLLVPHVNESGSWCEVPANPNGAGNSRAIRFGLQFVKGLASKTIDAIAQARRDGGPFHSLPDLLSRVEMSRQEITMLVKVGACDDLAVAGADATGMPSIIPTRGTLGEATTAQAIICDPVAALNRRQLLWLLPSLLSASTGGANRRARKEHAHWKSATGTEGKSLQVMMGELIEGDTGVSGWQQTKVLGRPGNHRIEVPSLDDLTPSEKLRQEQEALGFVVSRNEMELVEAPGAISSSDLYAHSDSYSGREVQVAGVIAAGRRHMGKDGNWMLFMTLQDREGLIEVVVFSDAYKEHGELLATHGYGPYMITGTVQVSGKGRGIGVQPPSNLTLAGDVQLKSHPILIATRLAPIDLP